MRRLTATRVEYRRGFFDYPRVSSTMLTARMAPYERTIRARTASMQQLLSADLEQAPFDTAALVVPLAKQGALNRLFHLCEEGVSQ
jgi:hypothetical protein